MTDIIVIDKYGKQNTYHKKDIISLYGTEERLLIENYNFKYFQEIQNGRLRPIKSFKSLSKEDCKNNINILGIGEYGKVYSIGDSPIVCKKCNTQDSKDDIEIELCLLNCCINDISLQFLAKNSIIFYDKNNKIVNMYLKRFKYSLDSVLKNKQHTGKEKIILFNILKDYYRLQKRGIIHLDLKFENILVSQNEISTSTDFLEITDLGLSHFFPYCRQINKTSMTSTYRSPEVFIKKTYDSSADIYSLGLIFLELFLNKTHIVFKKKTNISKKQIIDFFRVKNIFLDDEDDIFKNILSVIYDINKINELDKLQTDIIFPTICDIIHDFYGIILCTQMLSNNPLMRPTIAECLNHPYFDDLQNNTVFHQYTYTDILNFLPPLKLNNNSCNYNLNNHLEKYKIFIDLIFLNDYFSYSLKVFFLCIRFINLLIEIDTEKTQLQWNDSAPSHLVLVSCLILTSNLCFENNYDINTITQDFSYSFCEISEMLFKVFTLLQKYQVLYGTIPLMYINTENISLDSLKKLFLMEISYPHLYIKQDKDILNNLTEKYLADISEKINLSYLENYKKIEFVTNFLIQLKKETWSEQIQNRNHLIDSVFIKKMETIFTKDNIILQSKLLRDAIIEIKNYV